LFIEDGCDVKVSLIAKMHIIGALSALKPLGKLLLRAFLTKIVKDGPFLFILKDRGRLLASRADTIPQVLVSGVSFEAPDDYSSWYPSHESLFLRGRIDVGVSSFPCYCMLRSCIEQLMSRLHIASCSTFRFVPFQIIVGNRRDTIYDVVFLSHEARDNFF